MPVFHTKTIEQILEPVADQVSHLVILHEEGEDGAAMPSLLIPITAVKSAVTNLAAVGHEQIKTSKDKVLAVATPVAIEKVENSANLLMSSAEMLEDNKYSKQGREKLISGARGILQGTSDLLLVFDEFEVRKICLVCRGVRELLKISECVQVMEDLVTYVKNLSPGMTNMSKMVTQRSKDLTNTRHAEKLESELVALKIQLPNLLSSMKAYVGTVKGTNESGQKAANSNRLFYVKTISDGITEIIRLLQLVSTDQEIQIDRADILKLKEARNQISKNVQPAKSWLNDPNAQPGTEEELALRKILDDARLIGYKAGGKLGKKVVEDCAKIGSMIDKLAELRRQGKGNSPEAKALARQIDSALNGLLRDIDTALQGLEDLDDALAKLAENTPIAKEWLCDPSAAPGAGSTAVNEVVKASRQICNAFSSDPAAINDCTEMKNICHSIDDDMVKLLDYRKKGEGHLKEAFKLSKDVSDKIGQLNTKAAHLMDSRKLPDTLNDKMAEVNKWLDNIHIDDGGRGVLVARSILGDARKLSGDSEKNKERQELQQATADCDEMCNQLDEMKRSGVIGSPRSKEIAKALKARFSDVNDLLKSVLVTSVAEDFSDTTTALKQLAAAASAPLNVPNRESNFDLKVENFEDHAARLLQLGKQAVAVSDLATAEKIAAANAVSKKINDLTPQVVNAGRIVLQFPDDKVAQDHFKLLRDEWSEHMDNLTEQVDNSMDFAKFIKAAEEGIHEEHKKCVNAMADRQPLDALTAAGNIARRAHRILMTGKREVENSEEANYVDELKTNLNQLGKTINPVVEATRSYAQNNTCKNTQNTVKAKNEDLIQAVANIRTTVEAKIIEENMKKIEFEQPESAPDRPPLPLVEEAPPVPPLPEEEEEFPEFDEKNDPAMMQAARELHDEAIKWESKGNDIISAAKRMALLMAKMSKLVRGEGGKKSELIGCAKEIAKASNEVRKLALEVADKCTDKRIRTDMCRTVDRIPTISTQLRILSTVKAASLGDSNDMSEEEEKAAVQATEMLVHNAQNLMSTVKDTVRNAEAASIRIRTDTRMTMRWVRKS